MISNDRLLATYRTIDEITRNAGLLIDPSGPGFTRAVVTKNRTSVLSYGFANVDAGLPLTVDTLLPIGSITKQFIAVGVWQLIAAGKVDLNDPISNYLSPPHDGIPHDIKATVSDLLTHVSGFAREPIGLYEDTTLDVTTRQKTPPGYPAYSNANAHHLGQLLERVSSLSLEDFLKRHLWRPLAMDNTRFLDPTGISAKGHGTLLGGRRTLSIPGRETATLGLRLPAAAGAVANIHDLSRFAHFLAFGNPQILPKNAHAEMLKIHEPSTRTHGHAVFSLNQQVFLGHAGQLDGNRAGLVVKPGEVGAVVLANTSDLDAVRCALAYADAHLQAIASNPEFVATNADVEYWSGTYEGNNNDVIAGPIGNQLCLIISRPLQVPSWCPLRVINSSDNTPAHLIIDGCQNPYGMEPVEKRNQVLLLGDGREPFRQKPSLARNDGLPNREYCYPNSRHGALSM